MASIEELHGGWEGWSLGPLSLNRGTGILAGEWRLVLNVGSRALSVSLGEYVHERGFDVDLGSRALSFAVLQRPAEAEPCP